MMIKQSEGNSASPLLHLEIIEKVAYGGVARQEGSVCVWGGRQVGGWARHVSSNEQEGREVRHCHIQTGHDRRHFLLVRMRERERKKK